jgi:DNA polymerase I-like protein with 3'-5' exonuclease and polymerase domains
MELPYYQAAKQLTVDLETYDPNIEKLGPGWATGDGHIIGYGIGVVGAPKYTRYISVRHEGYANSMEPESAKAYMKELLRLPIPKIFFNAPYDLGWLKREGIRVAGPCHCAMGAAALIDERRNSYSLNNVGEWLVGQRKMDLGIDGSELYRSDPKAVGEYCCGDVNLTSEVWMKEEPIIKKDELSEVLKLESDLLPLWVQMRWNGISIDEERLSQLKQEMLAKSKELVDKVLREYRCAVDLWAAASIAKLCAQEGVPFALTPTGRPSFTRSSLELSPHPALRDIAAARRLDKIANTFLVGLQRYLVKGKVHAEIHPMKSDDGGTVTGRLSISNPGLHQMPGKKSGKELARMVRGLFIPSKGVRCLASLDYSQQEPRLQIHYASVLGLQGAAQAVKQFTDNPRTDYHQFTADLIDFPREQAKIINLGLAYGMGVTKLAASLRCTFEEAKLKLDKYYAGMPWMRELQRVCANKAAERGFIRTILGRRCRYTYWEPAARVKGDPSPMLRAQAVEYWPDQPLRRAFTFRGMNGLIQGGAADQIKKAMHHLYYDHKVVPLLSLHDEILVEVSDEKEAEIYRSAMENAIPLKIPVVVDLKIGTTWGDCI